MHDRFVSRIAAAPTGAAQVRGGGHRAAVSDEGAEQGGTVLRVRASADAASRTGVASKTSSAMLSVGHVAPTTSRGVMRGAQILNPALPTASRFAFCQPFPDPF